MRVRPARAQEFIATEASNSAREARLTRLIRAWSGLLQNDFADRANIHPSSLSRFENGHDVPSHEQWQRLAAAAGVNLAVLGQAVTHGEGGNWTEPAEGHLVEELARRLAAAAAPALSRSDREVSAQQAMTKQREQAKRLWERLECLNPRQRRILVENARPFWTEALCARLCDESEIALLQPEQAQEFSQLALVVAGRLPFQNDGPLQAQAQAFAWAFVANGAFRSGEFGTYRTALACRKALLPQLKRFAPSPWFPESRVSLLLAQIS